MIFIFICIIKLNPVLFMVQQYFFNVGQFSYDLENEFIFAILNKCIICVALVAIFCAAYIPSLSEGGENAILCAYNAEYDCQNEAKHDDDKYPAIDGKEYCKMHWKEKNAEVNGESAEE